MRVLAVEPGPNFSVADVHRGWVKALRADGHQVANMSFAARLEFYERARKNTDGTDRYTTETACRLALCVWGAGVGPAVVVAHRPDVRRAPYRGASGRIRRHGWWIAHAPRATTRHPGRR